MAHLWIIRVAPTLLLFWPKLDFWQLLRAGQKTRFLYLWLYIMYIALAHLTKPLPFWYFLKAYIITTSHRSQGLLFTHCLLYTYTQSQLPSLYIYIYKYTVCIYICTNAYKYNISWSLRSICLLVSFKVEFVQPFPPFCFCNNSRRRRGKSICTIRFLIHNLIFYWSIIDLQYGANLCCTTKWCD